MSVPSLFTLAAQILASIRCNPIAQSLPKEVNEQLVLHMKALDLSELVDNYGGMYKLFKKFSLNAFQKFYMRFYKLYEKHVHPKTKQKMKKQLDDFILDYIVNLQNNKNNFVDMEFCIKSLGFHHVYSSNESKYLYYFFHCKFNCLIMPHTYFPVPDLPLEWINHLPFEVDTAVLPCMAKQINKNLFVFSGEMNFHDNFFFRLLALCKAYTNGRTHETLAYGLELLSKQTIYEKDLKCRKYIFHIYGIVAVTLAELHINLDICLGFLQEAKNLAHVYCQKLDILFYEQQLFTHFDLYDLELKVFDKLFNLVPMHSDFYLDTYKKHFECMIFQVENYFCQALCFSGVDFRTDVINKSRFKCLIKQTRSILEQEKKFIYKCLSIEQKYERDFELYGLILEVYILCLDNLEVEFFFNFQQRSECLALQLGVCYEKKLFYFFKHLTKPITYSFEQMTQDVNNIQESMATKMHLKQGEKIGHLYFTYFLLFQILANDSEKAIQWLDKAMEIFKLNQSLRYQVGWHFKQKNTHFVVPSHSTTPQQVNILQLLHKNPKISKFTKLGIVSVDEYNKRYF